MQQLKNFCEYRLTKATKGNKSAWNMILAKIKDDELIEREKQQTINFAENYELYESDKYPRKTFEQYYNETFKNK